MAMTTKICGWCQQPITDPVFSEIEVHVNGKVNRVFIHTICVRGWELENEGFIAQLTAPPGKGDYD